MLLNRSQPGCRVGMALTWVLLAVAAPVLAAGEPLPLGDAVTRALRDGPEAKIAHLESGEADDAASQARSVYWPQAAVSSEAGWSNRQNETLDAINGQGQLKRYPLSSLGSNSAWLSVYVDQLLFDLRSWRGVERSQLEADVAAVTEAQQREVISYEVLERYVNVLRLQDLCGADTSRVAAAEALDHQAQQLLDAGRVLAAEREQAALELAEAQLALDSQQRALDDARGTLARALGEDELLGTLVPDSLPAPVVTDGGAAAEEAVRGAPELRILDLRRRMEEISLKAARAGYLPTLSVRGGYFHYGTKRYNSFEDELAIGVDLKMPVFDGFRTSSAVDGASKAAEAARLRYDSMRETKRARVRELVARLVATAKQPALAARRADVARERLRLADLALQNKRGTLSDALAARADVTRDAAAAIDAHYDRILLWASLQSETGRLAEALTGTAAAPQP